MPVVCSLTEYAIFRSSSISLVPEFWTTKSIFILDITLSGHLRIIFFKGVLERRENFIFKSQLKSRALLFPCTASYSIMHAKRNLKSSSNLKAFGLSIWIPCRCWFLRILQQHTHAVSSAVSDNICSWIRWNWLEKRTGLSHHSVITLSIPQVYLDAYWVEDVVILVAAWSQSPSLLHIQTQSRSIFCVMFCQPQRIKHYICSIFLQKLFSSTYDQAILACSWFCLFVPSTCLRPLYVCWLSIHIAVINIERLPLANIIWTCNADKFFRL